MGELEGGRAVERGAQRADMLRRRLERGHVCGGIGDPLQAGAARAEMAAERVEQQGEPRLVGARVRADWGWRRGWGWG